MRLGKLEKQILIECLKHRSENRRNECVPDLYRDELPALLFGWKTIDTTRWGSSQRGYKRGPFKYERELYPDFNVKQAALTRALQTLYAKGLIDCGSSYEATELNVYSERRAAALNRQPSKKMRERYTDADLDRSRINPVTGYRFTIRDSQGSDLDRELGRNIKSLRLTSEGLLIAQNLSKS